MKLQIVAQHYVAFLLWQVAGPLYNFRKTKQNNQEIPRILLLFVEKYYAEVCYIADYTTSSSYQNMNLKLQLT
jgi:hypothetical protein